MYPLYPCRQKSGEIIPLKAPATIVEKRNGTAKLGGAYVVHPRRQVFPHIGGFAWVGKWRILAHARWRTWPRARQDKRTCVPLGKRGHFYFVCCCRISRFVSFGVSVSPVFTVVRVSAPDYRLPVQQVQYSSPRHRILTGDIEGFF